MHMIKSKLDVGRYRPRQSSGASGVIGETMKPRPILVKFISYRKIAEVFKNKKNLKAADLLLGKTWLGTGTRPYKLLSKSSYWKMSGSLMDWFAGKKMGELILLSVLMDCKNYIQMKNCVFAHCLVTFSLLLIFRISNQVVFASCSFPNSAKCHGACCIYWHCRVYMLLQAHLLFYFISSISVIYSYSYYLN